MKAMAHITTLGLGLAALCLALAAPAFAVEPIDSFSSTLSTVKVGGHPDIETEFTLAEPGVKEAARNITINTPEGVFGNPKAVDQCSSLAFASDECQSSSQAGLITIRANHDGDPNQLLGTAPIYNLDPGPDRPALFAFIVPTLGIPISIPVEVRTSQDYGLRFTVSNITQLTPLAKAKMIFWGFPALEAHDTERFPKGAPGEPAGCPGEEGTACITGGVPAAISVHPLTDNPTVCTGESLPVTLDVQTYQDPENVSHAEDTYPPITDCENESFKPVLFSAPTTKEADSASGLDISLRDPQELVFAAAPSQIRSAVVMLPEGLTINPDAADGQQACSDDQLNLDSEGPASCPDSAKIGTIAIHSIALEGTLEGSIYIGEPKPGDQYRLFMTTDGFGLHMKLVGSFHPDPLTGQVSAHFEDLPQAPFDRFDIHLFASDRGLVATPTRCGVYDTKAVFYPWNSLLPPVDSTQIFSVESGPSGSPCPGQIRPFNPTLEAGTSSSVAGAHSAFALQLNREDGDQFLGDLNFKMPPGFTGNLRGISYCPESSITTAATKAGRAEQSVPSCPLSSQVGTSNVAAGPGAHPFHAVGRMYLAGPFKGAPLSLVAVTPALAGPYDYGTVVIRVALKVDPLTAQVSAASETMPQIIGGIPIRMRSIRVSIDRPNFTINPTNCHPMTVDSQGIGDQGTATDFSSYFHVDNCSSLGFGPKMTIRQTGGRKGTRRTSNPTLRFDLTTRPGDANIKSLSLTLPPAFAIDQRHLGNVCSEKELAEKQCAGRTPIGRASTATPLLEKPLEGPAYAVSGSGGLPKLAFILNGQVNLVPRAETKTIVKGGAGRLQTTVPVVPDAPIGHFRLTVFGGKTGYLVNTRSLCGKAPTAKTKYTGQNGKTFSQSVHIKTPCKGTGNASSKAGSPAH